MAFIHQSCLYRPHWSQRNFRKQSCAPHNWPTILHTSRGRHIRSTDFRIPLPKIWRPFEFTVFISASGTKKLLTWGCHWFSSFSVIFYIGRVWAHFNFFAGVKLFKSIFPFWYFYSPVIIPELIKLISAISAQIFTEDRQRIRTVEDPQQISAYLNYARLVEHTDSLKFRVGGT